VSELFVGLDLGTSAVKVGVFDRAGRLLRLARRGYALHVPRPGWAEQDPEEWWAATCASLREVLAGVDAARIAAVGLSGQAPGQVLVAADGEALGPAIVWSDRRAVDEAAWLAARIAPEQALAWTGSTTIASASYPPARLQWLKAHRHQDWQRSAAVLQPKDFIAMQLTGRLATDVHSGFGLLQPQTAGYADAYLALLEVERERLPHALLPTDVVGEVTAAAAARSGLPAATPVVTGTIDAWCSILGCGGVEPGCAVDISGTSEVVAVVADRPASGDGVFSSLLMEGLYWIGGPTQMGGAALEWMADGFYKDGGGFGQMEAEASAVAPGAGGLLFLPYLRGERAPVWDDTTRGAFVGLTDNHTRAHCARAVYEGVALAVWDILDRSLAATGLCPSSLRVSGAGASSLLWNQIKADVTGLPVQQMAVSETACLGAALLAALGTGAFARLDAATAAMIHPASTLEPQEANTACYVALRPLWRGLYPALRDTLSQLSQSGVPVETGSWP
jgi:xylulokinase